MPIKSHSFNSTEVRSQYLPSMYKILGSISSHTKKAKQKFFFLWSLSVASSNITLTTLGIEVFDYMMKSTSKHS